jgi:phage protein D
MAQSADDTRFKPARPAILVAGKDEPALAQGLLEMLIVETTQGLYRCEARFGNWGKVGSGMDFLYLDRKKLDFGKSVEIKLGDLSAFKGAITGLDAHFQEGAAPELTVLAEDRLQDLRMTRRTRVFTDQSDADVFRRVAQDHSLDPDVDITGPTHKLLAQHNQSDLAFVRERARSLDAELWVDGKKFFVRSRASRNGGNATLAYGKQLLELSVLADLSEQRSKVKVSGWDPAAKDALEHTADQAVLGSELGNHVAGAEVLGRAFKDRTETLVHRVPTSSAEAKAMAEAHFKLRARRFVVGRGRAQADARLRVGSFVELSGISQLFEGKYYLSEVRHLFDGEKGMRSEFVAERPGIGRI